MKTTLLFLLFAVSITAQPSIHLWRVTPDSVCPGDSIKLDYKCLWPTQPDLSTNYIYLDPADGTPIIWQGNWSILKNRPKEHYTGLATGDSTYWIKVKLPTTVAVGTHSVYANGAGTFTFYVKNCTCTVTADFSIAQLNDSFTLTSTSVGTNSNTAYSWSFYGTYQTGTSTASIIYTPGTYTISLMVANTTCTDVVSKTVTVQTTTGIEEYKLDKYNQAPIFTDILGRRIDPQPGGWYIMQVGEQRKQVIFKPQ